MEPLQLPGAKIKQIYIPFSLILYSPSAPQNHNITPAAQFILDDTSLAAISLANGDRQLYFQDNSGLIQRAIRTATNNQWSTSANQNLSSNSNPKNYTPLAVIVDDLSSVLIKSCTVLMQTDLYPD